MRDWLAWFQLLHQGLMFSILFWHVWSPDYCFASQVFYIVCWIIRFKQCRQWRRNLAFIWHIEIRKCVGFYLWELSYWIPAKSNSADPKELQYYYWRFYLCVLLYFYYVLCSKKWQFVLDDYVTVNASLLPTF